MIWSFDQITEVDLYPRPFTGWYKDTISGLYFVLPYLDIYKLFHTDWYGYLFQNCPLTVYEPYISSTTTVAAQPTKYGYETIIAPFSDPSAGVTYADSFISTNVPACTSSFNCSSEDRLIPGAGVTNYQLEWKIFYADYDMTDKISYFIETSQADTGLRNLIDLTSSPEISILKRLLWYCDTECKRGAYDCGSSFIYSNSDYSKCYIETSYYNANLWTKITIDGSNIEIYHSLEGIYWDPALSTSGSPPRVYVDYVYNGITFRYWIYFDSSCSEIIVRPSSGYIGHAYVVSSFTGLVHLNDIPQPDTVYKYLYYPQWNEMSFIYSAVSDDPEVLEIHQIRQGDTKLGLRDDTATFGNKEFLDTTLWIDLMPYDSVLPNRINPSDIKPYIEQGPKENQLFRFRVSGSPDNLITYHNDNYIGSMYEITGTISDPSVSPITPNSDCLTTYGTFVSYDTYGPWVSNICNEEYVVQLGCGSLPTKSTRNPIQNLLDFSNTTVYKTFSHGPTYYGSGLDIISTDFGLFTGDKQIVAGETIPIDPDMVVAWKDRIGTDSFGHPVYDTYYKILSIKNRDIVITRMALRNPDGTWYNPDNFQAVYSWLGPSITQTDITDEIDNLLSNGVRDGCVVHGRLDSGKLANVPDFTSILINGTALADREQFVSFKGIDYGLIACGSISGNCAKINILSEPYMYSEYFTALTLQEIVSYSGNPIDGLSLFDNFKILTFDAISSSKQTIAYDCCNTSNSVLYRVFDSQPYYAYGPIIDYGGTYDISCDTKSYKILRDMTNSYPIGHAGYCHAQDKVVNIFAEDVEGLNSIYIFQMESELKNGDTVYARDCCPCTFVECQTDFLGNGYYDTISLSATTKTKADLPYSFNVTEPLPDTHAKRVITIGVQDIC